jgi:DNA-binding IclR family transcriptional regulator
MTEEIPNVPVKSVETAFAIVNAIQELNGAGITEIAEQVGKSKSTVHNHLQTLKRHRYVIEDGGSYRLGLRFLDHGSHARERNPSYTVIQPKVREIAEETGEICQFVVEEGGRGFVVFHEGGEHAVEIQTRIGMSGLLNGITGGKAILAYLSDRRIEEIVSEHGLPALTDDTITDSAELFERLEQIRNQGYAINNEEHIKGLRAISVPIKTTESKLFGAMSVASPSYRLEEPNYEKEVTDLLLGAANELELNVTYSRF